MSSGQYNETLICWRVGNPYDTQVNKKIGLVNTDVHHYVSSDGTINP
jgi:hypothetical protein